MAGLGNRFTAVLLVGVIFAAGIAVGVVVDRKWLAPAAPASSLRPPGFPSPERAMAHFRRRLDLSAEQATAIEAILGEISAEAGAIHARVEPELRAIMARTNDEIRALLTPEQAEEFTRMHAEIERRMGAKKRGFGGPGMGRGPGMRGDRAQAFAEIDVDGDGKLSRQECEKSERRFASFLLSRFAEIDADGDGQVAREELGRMRRGMGMHGGPPPGP